MRLIDADALEELFREVIGCIAKRPEINGNLEHMVRASAMAVEMIGDAQTVDAVPLEPLCVWLAGYKAPPPEYALKAVGAYDEIDPDSVVYTANQVRDAWKYAMRNMLACGLLMEEQDG